MLRLHSKTDRPDFNYLNKVLQDSLSHGIKVQVSSALQTELQNELISAKLALQSYGVYSPTKRTEIIEVLEELSKSDEAIRECCFVNGKWTTAQSSLKKLAHTGNQFAIDLIYYRRVSKYLSYIDNLISFADDDSYIHPVLCGSTTNRVQYKDPGLMNIPKQILWSVIQPRNTKWSLYSVDIKNQEPWILINMLDIQELKDLLALAKNGSLYDMLFATFYNKMPTEIERKEFKTAWNALTYGATKMSIKSSCNNIDSEVVYSYFNKLSGYKKYKKDMNAKAYSGCKRVNTLFGTEMVANGDTKQKVVRQLMNLGIQGTGADILAFLVKHFVEEVKQKNIYNFMHIYFTRHDECVIEVSKYYEKKLGGEAAVCSLLFDMFEHQIDDWEPFNLEVHKIREIITGVFKNTDLDEDAYDED